MAEAQTREKLEQALKACEYALASLEVPADEQDAIVLQGTIEDAVNESRRAFDLFSEEAHSVWPSMDPRR